MKIIHQVYSLSEVALERGITYETVKSMPIHQHISAMKTIPAEKVLEKLKNLYTVLTGVYDAVHEER